MPSIYISGLQPVVDDDFLVGARKILNDCTEWNELSLLVCIMEVEFIEEKINPKKTNFKKPNLKKT